MPEFTLFNRYRSSASHRVRIALNLKKIPFNYRVVPLAAEMTAAQQEEYLNLNPMNQVPTLEHQGYAIAQSMAILDYLDRILPNNPLFPSEPVARAHVIQACEMINSGTQPLMNSNVLRRLGTSESEQLEWARHWIKKGLSAFEKFIAPTAGRFCFGDRPGAADCFLLPQLVAADRFHVERDLFPRLKDIGLSCESLSEFQLAAPERQPDFPKR